ncbi:Phosphoglycerate dehydrogenase [Rhizobiales bacterium GAS113]|nr:Phosphoglycerate dehydrogenase [Rhizobiales bacterium GAS113]
MRLALLDDYQGVAPAMADWASLGPGIAVDSIREPLRGFEAAAARLGDYDIVIAMRERTPFPRALFERLPKLKLLVTTGLRNAAIDLVAAAERGVLVCGTGMLPHPTAELTLGLILSLARQIPHEHQGMRQGAWQTTLGMGLKGRLLGVVGLGKLGAEVTRLAKAFGMQAIAWSQNLTAERATQSGAERVEKLELFGRADIVSIQMVLSERSRGLVDAAAIGAMKPSAYLVNTSRGPIVDTAALIAALETHRIAGAAIDVYDEEPLPADHKLRRLDNVVLTPHLGYVTEENYRTAYGDALADVKAFLAGAPLRVLQAG